MSYVQDRLVTMFNGSNSNRIAYSVKEAAEMLNLPLSTLHQFIRNGDLHCHKLGRHYRITKENLLNFMDKHEVL